MEISDVLRNSGTIWALPATLGRCGMFKSPVCEDWMVVPSGSVILMGLRANYRFVTGAPGKRKCPIAPESATVCDPGSNMWMA